MPISASVRAAVPGSSLILEQRETIHGADVSHGATLLTLASAATTEVWAPSGS